ncbi:MAG TPA: hypothetical protein VE861_05730 [Gemmatimonadaceae bacterium]|nr:hypothetical protein [Gemmatimonadaceae bacterium]
MSEYNPSNYRRDRYSDDVEFRRSGDSPSATFDQFDSSRGRGQRGKEKLSEAKDKLTQGFSTASHYFKSRDASEMMTDVRVAARKNPKIAILALAAIGFLIGRGMRRSR